MVLLAAPHVPRCGALTRTVPDLFNNMVMETELVSLILLLHIFDKSLTFLVKRTPSTITVITELVLPGFVFSDVAMELIWHRRRTTQEQEQREGKARRY